MNRKKRVEEPRFEVEPPWIGPQLGHQYQHEQEWLVPIGGAVHPSREKAFAVIRVRVVADGRGSFSAIYSGKDWKAVTESRDGWFKIEEKRSLWDNCDGVVVAMLYATSQKLGTDSPFRDEDTKEIKEAFDRFLTGAWESPLPGLIYSENVLNEQASNKKDVTFAIASCQYPPGMLDKNAALSSYQRLGERLEKDANPRPGFLLLVGDQVYVDATAGLFDPSDKVDRYVRPHSRLFSMRQVSNVLRHVPAYMMLDDHEIEDNWEPPIAGLRNDSNLAFGVECYLRFQRFLGPPGRPPTRDSKHPLWYTFENGGLPFFVADTRTERDRRWATNIDEAKIMSDTQFAYMLDWLRKYADNKKTKNLPKFVATPSILLPRHAQVAQLDMENARAHPASALRSDSWDGYPYSFHRLLAHIAERRIQNVVFLSGDEHISCIVHAEIAAKGARPVTITSIHSSALYAPFPFANAIEEDFVKQDLFEFEVSGTTYTCDVAETQFFPGDGFAVIHVFREARGWSLQCEFDRAEREHVSKLFLPD